jgi:hypothetical protein
MSPDHCYSTRSKEQNINSSPKQKSTPKKTTHPSNAALKAKKIRSFNTALKRKGRQEPDPREPGDEEAVFDKGKKGYLLTILDFCPSDSSYILFYCSGLFVGKAEDLYKFSQPLKEKQADAKLANIESILTSLDKFWKPTLPPHPGCTFVFDSKALGVNEWSCRVEDKCRFLNPPL